MKNNLKLKIDEKKRYLKYYQLLQISSSIIIIFVFLVSIILIINHLRFRKADPLNSKVMQNLIQQMQQTNINNNELKNSIKEYDILIRKAHFSSIAFNKFGIWILLGSVILFLLCRKIMFELNRKTPHPLSPISDTDSYQVHKYLPVISLTIFMIFSIIATILSKNIDSNNNAQKKNRLNSKNNLKNFASEDEMRKNWPAFRGYNSLGILNVDPDSNTWHNLTDKNIIWKTPVNKPGFNSPVLWENKIFITGADSEKRTISCFDLQTGKLIWSRNCSLSNQVIIPEVTEDTGLAAPTIATNGYFIAAVFATGELIVCNLNGKIIWQKQLPSPANHYGHSSSLITHRNILYVQYDFDESATIYAFNIENGETIWQKQREVDISWSSPVIVNGSNDKKLILTAFPDIIGYDLNDGTETFKINETIEGEIGPSPAFLNDKLYVVNQFSILACIDIYSKKIIWQTDENLSDVASPVAFNNFLISPTSFGKVTCFNALTGNKYWTHKFETGFYASPIANQRELFLIDRKGNLTILKLSEKFHTVSKLSLNEDVVATPALIDNKLIIRSKNHLYCIAGKDK